MALQPQATTSFRKHVLALIGETYGDKTLCLCPTGFVRLFRGDHKAAILLSQILYWAERTKDPDGWFYKSYADWRAETGLSEAQVRRIVNGDPRVPSPQVTLRAVGVETKLQKVKRTGAPTLHYRVNQAQLIAALQTLMGQGDPPQAEESILNIAEDRSSTLLGMNPEQCAVSLIPTEISPPDQIAGDQDHPQHTDHPDEDSDLALFFPFEDRFGKMKPPFQAVLRAELARLGAEQVQTVLERCATRGRSWNYVQRALANEAAAEPVSAPSAALFQPFTGDPEPMLPKTPEMPLLPVSERVQLPLSNAGKATTAQAVWEASYQQLEFQLDPSSFAVGVRGSVLVDFDPETRTLIVATRNEPARALLEQRLARTVRRILSDVSGQPMELEYLTGEDWQQRVAHDATAAA